MLFSEIRRAVDGETEVVLFNIDSKADAKAGREAILNVFMRVFNEMQGFSSEYPYLAEMERQLTQRSFEHPRQGGKGPRPRRIVVHDYHWRLGCHAHLSTERDCRRRSASLAGQHHRCATLTASPSARGSG